MRGLGADVATAEVELVPHRSDIVRQCSGKKVHEERETRPPAVKENKAVLDNNKCVQSCPGLKKPAKYHGCLGSRIIKRFEPPTREVRRADGPV